MTHSLTHLAERPARFSTALKIGLLLLAADIVVLGGKALATDHASAERPAAIAALPDAPIKMQCREATVNLDEGYGLQGHKTKVICVRAL